MRDSAHDVRGFWLCCFPDGLNRRRVVLRGSAANAAVGLRRHSQRRRSKRGAGGVTDVWLRAQAALG